MTSDAVDNNDSDQKSIQGGPHDIYRCKRRRPTQQVADRSVSLSHVLGYRRGKVAKLDLKTAPSTPHGSVDKEACYL
jgi:hypothetical protein